MPNLQGMLLVASPALLDPNFARAVVLILDHGDDGAIGVILNRPSDVAVRDAVPAWADQVTEPAVVYAGGPVSPAIGICLIAGGGAIGALDGVTVGSFDAPPSGPPCARLFAGYAGWDTGQLEDELAENAWIVCEASDTDVTTPQPAQLWRDVLRRQKGSLRWLAHYPADVSLN